MIFPQPIKLQVNLACPQQGNIPLETVRRTRYLWEIRHRLLNQMRGTPSWLPISSLQDTDMQVSSVQGAAGGC